VLRKSFSISVRYDDFAHLSTKSLLSTSTECAPAGRSEGSSSVRCGAWNEVYMR
jgi:hypothetical protein